MKRVIVIALVLATVFSVCACGSTAAEVPVPAASQDVDPTPEAKPEPTPEPTPEPIAFVDDTDALNRAAASVVKLNCYDRNGEIVGWGSGFTAFEDGIVVTNYHVIEHGVAFVEAEMESGLKFDIDKIVALDSQRDIAILSTKVKAGLTLLPLGDSDGVVKGEKVVAIGYPRGLGNTISTGIISSIYEDEGEKILQYTAPISNGSSGGALFNSQGEVIGITYAFIDDAQNLNLAVPIKDVMRLWGERNEKDALTLSDIAEFSSAQPVAFTVSEIAKDPDRFEGQEVTVEGYISSICFYPGMPFMYLANDSADAICIIVKKDGKLIKERDIETLSINYKGDYDFVYRGQDGDYTSEEKRATEGKLIVISPATKKSEYLFDELYRITGIVKVSRKKGEFENIEIINAVFDH